MTVWELPVLCTASLLAGFRGLLGLKLLNGKEASCVQLWTDKGLYVQSGIWMAFYMLLWFGFGKSILLIRSADLLVTYGILAAVDAKYRIVPDSILICYFAAQMLLGALSTEPAALLQLFISGVIFMAAVFVLTWFSKGKMGMGDVKLLGVTAMTAGWAFVIQIFLLAVLLSFVYSIWLMLVGKKSIHTEFPFVPFLAAGIAIYMVIIK